jgi:hypothetical protein
MFLIFKLIEKFHYIVRVASLDYCHLKHLKLELGLAQVLFRYLLDCHLLFSDCAMAHKNFSERPLSKDNLRFLKVVA